MPAQLLLDKMVFRKTNNKIGRHLSATPGNSTNRHLAYGRIILDASAPAVQFATANRETGLICLSGLATVRVDGRSFRLGQYDAIYVPRDSQLEVVTNTQVDLVEFSADVEHHYPLQFVSFADVCQDPALRYDSGIPGQSRRHHHVLFGKNVNTGRLAAGFTYSEPGNWASWPPHEHAAALEEMYVYFNMPAPALALQLVYDNTEYPEMIIPVRDGDAVLMPSGYHPNVSVPGHRICYVWGTAAHREHVERKTGLGSVQPDFCC